MLHSMDYYKPITSAVAIIIICVVIIIDIIIVNIIIIIIIIIEGIDINHSPTHFKLHRELFPGLEC